MSVTVVLTLPEHGHINATLPVVSELVRRGERVIYFGTEPYRLSIEATDAEFVSYGDAIAFQPPAHTGGLYSVMAFLMTLTERVLPSVLERLRAERPDYLLVDSMCVWGRLASQVLKIPTVSLGSVFVTNEAFVSNEAMVHLAYDRAPKEVVLAGIDALNTYLEVSRRVDRQHGTDSPNLVQFFANTQPLNVLFTSRYFHPMGDGYDNRFVFVGPSMADRIQARVPIPAPSGRPVIFISLGTIFNDAPVFYHACFEAFGGGDYDVVLATGGTPEALGTPPDNFVIHPYVPQLDVLVRTSLFITHGGMNSTSEALWHGIPLLVFPQHGDQYLVAGQVSQLGAGLTMTPADVTPARLAELARQVLTEPRFSEGAHKVADSFKTAGGAHRAADAIVAFAQRTG